MEPQSPALSTPGLSTAFNRAFALNWRMEMAADDPPEEAKPAAAVVAAVDPPPVALAPVPLPVPVGPAEMRHACNHWLALAGVDEERQLQQSLYANLCAAPPPPSDVISQVEVDLTRTDLRLYECEHDPPEQAPERRMALRRVLLAFARLDPSTGYVQGMGDIAARALLSSAALDGMHARANGGGLITERAEAAAFWWLRHVTQSLLLGFFAPGMAAVWEEVRLLRRALLLLQPHLLAHLDELGCDLACVAPSWYLTLFQRILPRSECGPALTSLAGRKLATTHLALGVLLSREHKLLAARSFEAVTQALCSASGAEDAQRRVAAGALRAAHEAALAIPLALLKDLSDSVSDA
jgi:hypothetical protein